MKNIRNFCIIAHIDHGKSTLADRLLEFTGAITDREKQDQLLDDMDLERERGITIKSHAIQMYYSHNGEDFVLNLIDTPGHAAFTEMRARGSKITDIVVLVVAADDGVKPQTIEAIKHAKAAKVPIIVAINKCDLPEKNISKIKNEMMQYELIAERMMGLECV